MWALDVLLEQGHVYDASIFPIHHDRYGIPTAPRHAHRIQRVAGELWELPGSTVRCLGQNLPIGGGGYFRLLPYTVVERGIRRVNEREHQPVMFYLHPWELDSDQPRPPMRSYHRFRHYVGIEKQESKLACLLSQFRFGTARAFLEARVCGVLVFDGFGDRLSVAMV